MPIRELDDDQKLIATLSGDEVVVSAGAGSGKTRLLVGRYLYLVGAQGVPPSEIAAITFTNKAADSMKARIAESAPLLAERYPESAALWREVAEGIHDAPISTIHSFCNSILRGYPAEAGIDPLFEVLDETALAGLRMEALDSFLDARMDEDPDRMGFLLDVLGMRGLRKALLDMMERRPRMTVWLDNGGASDPETLECTYLRFFAERIDRYLYTLSEFHALRPGYDLLSPVLAELVAILENLRVALGGGGCDPEAMRIAVRSLRPGIRKGSPRAWEGCGMPLSRVKGGMRECLDLLDGIADWFEEERGRVSRAVSFLIEEYVRLDERFLRMKKERSSLDNDDSLVETWRLLRSNAGVCRRVSASWRHLLVDEFQDTDDLQLDILRMIAGNSSAKLFTVGDPKQSIYRFRGADVEVFNRFAARKGVDFKSLKIAYRSTPGIIAFVNHVFSRIMGTEGSLHPLFEVGYSEMKPARRNGGNGPDVEITVIDSLDADSRRASEGEFIAGRALELHAAGVPFGGMALLLRKGTRVRRYEEAFLRAGVPFVNQAGGNPFESPEALDIVNFLGWLCKPDDDTFFTGTLLSPMFQAGADLLVGLHRAAGRHGSLYGTLAAAGEASGGVSLKDESHQITEILGKLLVNRDRLTIRELLESAFDATGYTLALLADPVRGEESLAVLDAILGAADRFEQGGGGVREFARILRDGLLAAERGASVESRDDALSIITIHKAKGLEYRVVFLADASSRPRAESGGFLLHDALGPGVFYRTASGKQAKSLALVLAGETEKLKAVAESKRLFYVACTRAKDKLIISGGAPPKNGDPDFEHDQWMGWLHSALGISSEGEMTGESPRGLFLYRTVTDASVGSADAAVEFWRPLLESGGAPAGAGDAPSLDLALRDPPVRWKPTTLSPTQAEEYLRCPARYLYNRMYRLGDRAPGLEARYGELAHHVLEHWDYHDPNGIPVLVDRFARKDVPGSFLDRLKESLARFAGSDLRRTIAGADEVRREEPFVFLEVDVLVRGTMDLVARKGSSRFIVDFKTNRIAPEAVPEEAGRYHIQLGLYALALFRAHDIVPDRLAIHFLAPGVSHEIPCDRAFLDDAASMLARILASMEAGDFRPNRGDRCGQCPYGFLCGGGEIESYAPVGAS
jgi:ATP-dependent helicase/nuclease subunit A